MRVVPINMQPVLSSTLADLLYLSHVSACSSINAMQVACLASLETRGATSDLNVNPLQGLESVPGHDTGALLPV